MAVTLGIDLGTTTITSLAVDAASGEILAAETAANDTETTSASNKALGRSEWDAQGIVDRAGRCLKAVVERLGRRRNDLAGIGVTGQQHGVVVLDQTNRPLTPFIGWQDRRGAWLLIGGFVSVILTFVGADLMMLDSRHSFLFGT